MTTNIYEGAATLDVSSLLKTITQIQKCSRKEDLQTVIRDQVIPLLQEGYSYFDRRTPHNQDADLISCPGIFKDDRDRILKYLKRDSLARMMLTQQQREEPLSSRSQEILQWIVPQLMHKIKALMLQEELARTEATVETLMRSPVGIALIDDELKIVSCNKSFRDLFQVSSKDRVPENLARIFNKESSAPPDPDPDAAAEGTEISFFTLPQGNFKIIYYELARSNSDMEKLWLLRIHPASDPFTKSNMLIQKAGLTWREMEICCLIHDGLGRQEIADRLFISAHTVKTHLKKIHKKLGVNSRTQLVAYLNQHSDDSFDNQFS